MPSSTPTPLDGTASFVASPPSQKRSGPRRPAQPEGGSSAPSAKSGRSRRAPAAESEFVAGVDDVTHPLLPPEMLRQARQVFMSYHRRQEEEARRQRAHREEQQQRLRAEQLQREAAEREAQKAREELLAHERAASPRGKGLPPKPKKTAKELKAERDASRRASKLEKEEAKAKRSVRMSPRESRPESPAGPHVTVSIIHPEPDKASVSEPPQGPPPAPTLGLDAVSAVLRDMGAPLPVAEVKDMVYQLKQPAAVEAKNAKIARRATATGKSLCSGSMSRFGAETSQQVAQAPVGQDGALVLGFSLFLEVLCATLPDADEEEEMRQLWRAVDGDGDGVLGARDIQGVLALAESVATGAAPASRAATAGAAQQRVVDLLRELDFDDDGRITFDDFVASLNTN